MATTKGIIDKAFVSSLAVVDGLSLIEARDIYPQILDYFNEVPGIVDILELTGRTADTTMPEYYNLVTDWIYETDTVAADGTLIVAGASGTIKVTTGTYPKATELLMTKSGAVGYIRSISGKDMTVVAIGGSIPAADLVTGETLVFFSNAQGEGSGSPIGRRPNLTKYSNNIQIFKDSIAITDVQKGSKLSVNWAGSDNIMTKAQVSAFHKFRMDMGFQFLIGKGGKTTDANGKTVYMTKSILDYINTDGGIKKNFDTMDKANFADLNRELDRARAGAEYFLWTGTDFDYAVDDFVTSLFGVRGDGSGVGYNAFEVGAGNARQLAVDLGINSFRLYGRTFHKTKMPALNHPKVTATAGINFMKSAFMVPTDKVKVDGGGEVDRIRLRRLPVTGGAYHEIMLGKYAPTPTSDVSELSIHYETHQGLELLGAEHFGYLTIS